MKTKLLFFLLLYMLAFSQVFAQSRDISGKVTDPKTGEAIPGVSVFIKGATIGTVTDAEGNFKLSNVTNESVLVFQSVGLQTQEVLVGTQSTINLAMTENIKELGEIIVTAVAIEREKKEIGYSVEQVKGQDVLTAREGNLVNSLAGKFTGVQITNSSGQVGGSSRILIRGANSLLGQNQPLFVIDGVPMDNTQTFGGGQNNANGTGNGDSPLFFGGTSNRAIDIDPNTVESISILKGASATALYGQRGAQGVVLITTKKGEKGGKMKITYGLNYGFSNVRLPKFQETYGQGTGGAYFDGSFGKGVSTSWGPRMDTLKVNGQAAPSYDNRKDFFKTGIVMDHNITFSGGTNKSSYFSSYTYKDESGIVPGNTLKRHNLLAKFTTELSDKLTATVSMNYVNTAVNSSTEGNGVQSYLWGVWYAPVSYQLKPDTLFFPNGTQKMFTTTRNNPYFVTQRNARTSSVDRFLPQFTLSYKPVSWLTVMNRFGADIYTDKVDYHEAIGTLGTFTGGRLYNDRSVYRQLNNEFLVTFNKKFGDDFNVSALLGNQVNDINSNRTYVQGATLSVPDFYHISNASVVSSINFTSHQRLVSFYAQANLGYKDYLFLTLSGRNDISSTLPKSSRSFFYPSASVSFVLTEAFAGLQNNPVLSFAKLRVGLAQVGASAGPYNTQTTLYGQSSISDGQRGLINIPYNNINSYGISNVIGNPNLKPEKTNEIELGLEMEFFRKRIGLEATYYDRKSNNQIFQAPVPGSSGANSRIVNAGSIRNHGIELLLRANPVKIAGFSWNTTFTFTKNISEVVELTEGVESIRLAGFTSPGIYILRGQPYGVIYGAKYQRNANGKLIIGPNGLPLVDPTTGAIGNTQPKWLGSMRNTFTYSSLSLGNFGLSVLFDTRQGGDIMNLDKYYLIGAGVHPLTADRDGSHSIIYDGVREDGSVNNISIPINEAYWRTKFGGAAAGEDYVEDGTFYRLREVTFTYGFPASVLKKLPFKDVNIAVSGRNLWLKTPHFTGSDPESSLYGNANGQGFYNFITPNTVGWNFSLNVTF